MYQIRIYQYTCTVCLALSRCTFRQPKWLKSSNHKFNCFIGVAIQHTYHFYKANSHLCQYPWIFYRNQWHREGIDAWFELNAQERIWRRTGLPVIPVPLLLLLPHFCVLLVGTSFLQIATQAGEGSTAVICSNRDNLLMTSCSWTTSLDLGEK